MRHGLAGALGAIAALALAPAAGATTFFVDDGAASTNTACTQAAPCNTVTKAVTASAADSATPHTINVAAGLYNEPSFLFFNNANHTGLRLLGAGSGSDPAADTIIRRTSGPGLVLGASSPPQQTNMTASGIRVEADSNTVNAAGSTVTDAAFVGVTPTSSGTMLGLRAPTQRVERVTVRGSPESSGIFMDFSTPSTTDVDWTIRDVDVVSGDRGGIEQRGDATGRLLLQRARVQVPSSDFSRSVRTQGPMTVDSSLILGGAVAGVEAVTSEQVLLRNVTVDAGVPGSADQPVNGFPASVDGGSVRVQSSILLEQATGAGARCEVSNVRAKNGAGAQCPVGSQGNISSTPAQLFAAPGTDWRLLANAPAVDAGTTAGLAAGESALDLARAPRIFDGNGDGIARRDQGAFESQTVAPPPPGGGTGGPAAAPDLVRPLVTSARFSPRRFRVGRRSTRLISGRRTPRGSRLRWRLSEAADVRIRVERGLRGRRSRGRCRRPTRALRRKPRCTRFRRVRTLQRNNLKAGLVSMRFTGRFRGRALRPGPYRAVIVAFDEAGNRSLVKRAGFRIVR